MENYQEVLEFYHKLLKPTDKEKKQTGEVFTPFKLCFEMLGHLPIEVYKETNLSFFKEYTLQELKRSYENIIGKIECIICNEQNDYYCQCIQCQKFTCLDCCNQLEKQQCSLCRNNLANEIKRMINIKLLRN